MFKFWDNHGILGINARNLLYIKPLNKKAQIQFADDKMRTKQYLSARGINTARLLGKITSEAELMKFPFESLPNSFVLKPNAGFGGEGIWVIGNRENDGWLTVKGEFISHEDMLEHISDILDGRYSINGTPDTVFFEERLVGHPDMHPLGTHGLPDIRIIVYNLVPVMAMVRVPTKESNGKANIHVGGIGLGVDLAKGETTHMVHYNKIIKEHPELGKLKGLKIPFWNEVLLLATQIQQVITLGYLAVDIVIDANMGPTLLELNARAGLAVQVANLAPLRDRLDRVSGVRVQTAEKGVRMAQDLFGNKIERSIQALSGKQVIGMEEDVTLNLKHGTTTCVARMNPTMTKNYLEEGLFKKIAGEKEAESLALGYSLQGERGKTVFYPLDMTDTGYKVILGKKVLANFFLDVSRRPEDQKIPDVPEEEAFTGRKARSDDDYWHQIDNRLCELDKQLGLISKLRPLNLEGERKRFFMSDSYNPQFEYQEQDADMINIRRELQHMSMDLGKPLGRLFDEKRKELILRMDLLDVIGDDDHFPKKAEHLMGVPPEEVVKRAENEYKKLKKLKPRERRLSALRVQEEMEGFLKDQGLRNWQIKIKDGIVSRCVIAKNNRLLIKGGEFFSRWDVDKLIAHEIETHIFCTENGKLQPYQILRRGTGHYLKTQEGLAVYVQNEVVKGGVRDALIGFQAVLWGRELGFRDLYEKLLKVCSEEQAWKTAVKVKRGLTDTSQPGAFMKNALYYWGYVEVDQFVREGGDLKDLFVGKFEIHQLPLIQEIPELKEAQYLPRILDES